MNILFYILVPVYKAEKYIAACIDSVLRQTYTNWQLVLVDDGSPDKSGEICDDYAAINEKIHVIHQENMGPIAAREAARRFVRRQPVQDDAGIYILHLDSDDTFKPEALHVICEYIRKTGCDLLFFGCDRVHEGQVIKKDQPLAEFVGEITDKRELYNTVFNNTAYNSLWRKASRLSLHEDMDYTEYCHIRHGEDLLQSLMLYRNCRKVFFAGAALYNYTINPASITRGVSYENFKIDSTVRAKVLEFIKTENVMTEADIRSYLDYCRSLLLRTLRTISGFRIEYKQKEALLQQILADKYYRFLLEDVTIKNMTLWNLKNGRFHAVLVLCRLRRFPMTIKRQIKARINKRCGQRKHY